MVELIILSLLTVATLSASGQSYNLKYDLGFVGTLYAGGVISIVSNFTNSQLTIRIAGILFASDFWSNGTRDISLGPSFYLTAGMMKEVDTLVPIPPNAFIGNHNIDATADWQYSNSSGWFNATPIQTNKAVLVSQTIGSLFSSFVTILLIGLSIVGVVIVLIVILVFGRRKTRKPRSPLPGALSI